MYKYSTKFANQLEMFEASLPFGGTLNPNNRWIKMAAQVDWEKFEKIYAKTFASIGRPGKDARLVIGALILKHKLDVSDEEMAQQISENPYLQFFVGLATYHTEPSFDSSTLTHVRQRLDKQQFDQFEQTLIDDLIANKLLKPKGLLIDATVCESDISYPTDCGLLNKARQYCVAQIKQLSKIVGTKVRTYCRVAQQQYLNFTKRRQKTQQQIRQMQKSLLQYLRRNIRQMTELVDQALEKGHVVSAKVLRKLEIVTKIYEQQKYMYDNRVKTIESRIVSFHKSYIRPIVRNKSGKRVEFGPKVSLSHVDGYVFVDHYSTENYNESIKLEQSIENYKDKFGKYPDYVSMDQIYGSRDNRNYLNDKGIPSSVKPLGRKKKKETHDKEHRWRKAKQKERNRIEGAIGHVKTKYSLGEVRAKLPETEYSWLRLALLSHNVVSAAKRI
jgi:IS5 family transposase